MKVSELIQEIVEAAESKFGVSDHNNDCISVDIYVSPYEWQVSLARPTQRQLDSGEIVTELDYTIKCWEAKYNFHSHGETLMQALYALLEKVLDASREDFS
jgi:hypothetical protein